MSPAAAPSILVVEENPITRMMIRFTLESSGYRVMEAENGEAALRELVESPDLVLQDLALPDMDGLDLLSRIRRKKSASELPVLVLSGHTMRLDDLKEQGGSFDEFVTKPIEPSRLLEAIGRHVRGRAPVSEEVVRRERVLIVDDEPLNRKLAALRLRHAGFAVMTASGAEEALELAREHLPDAILSDVLMPGVDGFELCLRVRMEPRLERVPIVLVSASYLTEEDRRRAREMGAEAFITRTTDYREAGETLRRVMRARPGSPEAPREEPEGDLTQRNLEQFDRRTRANRALVQRTALQAATLSALSGISGLLVNPGDPFDLTNVLGDVLVNCLDATGLSTGLLYMREPSGGFRLHAHCGLTAGAAEAAAVGFGRSALFLKMIESGEPVGLTAADTGPEAARILLEVNHPSALVVPLIVKGGAHGALLLADDADVLAESSWLAFSRVLSTQLGQAIALGHSISQVAASELRYRSLFEGALEGIFESVPGGRFLTVNPAFARMLGYPSPEDLMASISDIGTQLYADPDERRSYIEALRSEGFVAGFEARFRRKDGTIAWLRVNTRAIRDEGGELGNLTGMAEDVTERHLAEAARRSSEDRYRVLFDNNPMPMWVYDRDELRIFAANRAAAEQYGYTTSELTALTLTDLRPPEEVVKLLDAMRTLQPGRDTGTWKHRRKDGVLLDVEVHSDDIVLEGRALRLAVLHDVTQQKSIEEQYRQAQKMEAIGRLAGGVAHDFNNLLTVINGYGDMLLSELPAEGRSSDCAAEIVRAGERAVSLTQQLLSFSRKPASSLENLDLNVVIADMDRMLRRLIGEDVVLRSVLDPGLQAIRANRSQLEQVVMNLVVNARDAMPGGGSITFETRNVAIDDTAALEHVGLSVGDHVLLAVSDTGTGMDAATKARMFEPFFTTKEAGKGTGLGLATVYGIVKQCGGGIFVDSEPGRGTTFEIYFPHAEAPAGNARTPKASGPPGLGQGANDRPTLDFMRNLVGTETILLAEDDEAVRRLTRVTLQGLGYKVLTAENAKTAMDLVGEHRGTIGLLLTDIVLPGSSGPALAEKVREVLPGVRTLYVSGYAYDAVVLHGILGRHEAFLGKPYTPQALAKKVREVLAKSGGE